MSHIINVAVAAAVAGLGLCLTTPSTMADELGLQFNSKDPGVLDGYGVFYVNGIDIYAGSGFFFDYGSSGAPYTFNRVSPGSIFVDEGYIYADFTSTNTSADYDIRLATSFTSGGKFGNQIQAVITDHGSEKLNTIGYFDTPIISVTLPGSSGGGSSGGGSSGGGSSGNAPSPEVNTLVGLLVAAGTAAFLRRRRGGQESASI